MKIEKSEVSEANKFVADSYSKSGIFLNVSDTGLKEYLYVNKRTNLVMFLDSYETGKDVFGDVKTQSEGVSEDFALKMLSIATKNDKFSEL